MKDFCVLLVILTDIGVTIWYVRQILTKRVSPTLSTWMMFFTGCILSFVTYAIAEDKDFRSGIMNTADVGFVTAILATLVFQGRGLKFKPFERWYLLAAAMVVVYGVVSGNMWNSNVLSQILMSFAYAPTIHKLFKERKNTESFVGWTAGGVLGGISLYPALSNGNALAVVYSARAFLLSLFLVLLMAYYQLMYRERGVR